MILAEKIFWQLNKITKGKTTHNLSIRNISKILIIVFTLLLFSALPAYSQGKDITRFGEDININKGQPVNGNVTAFGGSIMVNDRVSGNITSFGGDVRVNDRVNGDVSVFGGSAILSSNAQIDGDLAVMGGTIRKSPGAVVRGNETVGYRFRFNPFTSFLWGILSLIGTLFLSALVVAFLPDQTRILADTIEREPLTSFGVGLLATILIPFLFIALFLIIVVGWVLIPLVAITIPIIYFYGGVGAARWVGRRTISATHLVADSPIAQVLIGALILGIIGLIPIVGWLIEAIFLLFGLGAVLLSKFGTGKPWFGGKETKGKPQTPEAETKVA